MSKTNTTARGVVSSSLCPEYHTLTVKILENGDGCTRNAVSLRYTSKFNVKRYTGSRPTATPRQDWPAFHNVKGCEGWKLRSSRTQQVKSNWNPEIENLLDQCTHLLKLPSRAKHLYTTQGRKVEDLSQVSEGQLLYVSKGDPFTDPTSEAKGAKRKGLLHKISSEIDRMEHLKWLYGLTKSGCVLTVSTPQAGAPVTVEACKEPNHMKCHLKNVAMVTKEQSQELVAKGHEYHFMSHKKADQLHLSRLPDWMKDSQPQSPTMDCGTSHPHTLQHHTSVPPSSHPHTLQHHTSVPPSSHPHTLQHHTSHPHTLVPPTLHSPSHSPSSHPHTSHPPTSVPPTSHSPSSHPHTSHPLGYSTWVWCRRHLVLNQKSSLVLAVESVSSGAGLFVEQFRENKAEQMWKLSSEGYLSPCANVGLVVSVTGLSGRKLGLKLTPKAEHQGSSLCQRWTESTDADKRMQLLAFSKSAEDEYYFHSVMGEVCGHALLGGAAQHQYGYRLTLTDPSDTHTLVCCGCGTYLKKMHPYLLIEELEEKQEFQCSFWNPKGGQMKGLMGPLCCFAGRVDLSRYEVASTIKTLNTMNWSRLTTAEEIHKKVCEVAVIRRISVRIHQCGTLTGGVTVGVSSIKGIIAAAADVFAMAGPVTAIFLRDGSAVELFSDILKSSSDDEDMVHIWVTSREDFVSVSDNNCGGEIEVYDCPSDPHDSMPAFKETSSVQRVAMVERKGRQFMDYKKPLCVYVYSCGAPTDGAKRVLATSLDQLLAESTVKLSLTSLARSAFALNGTRITSFSDVNDGQYIAVTTTHTFFTDSDVQANVNRKARWARKHGISKRSTSHTD